MRESTVVKVVAIVSLATICVVALLRGIDSALVATVSAIIGGIAGYEFRKNEDRFRWLVRRERE